MALRPSPSRIALLFVCALGWVAGSVSPAHADPPPGHIVPRETGPPSSSSVGLFRLNFDQTKYVGHLQTYGFMVLQSYMRGLLPDIREAAPHLRVFMYFDAAGAYTDPDTQYPSGLPYRSTSLAHPYWALRSNGNPITFWSGTRHLYDIGDPGYQREWASRAAADALSGGFDGVFIDDVNFGEAARPGWSGPAPQYNTDLKWTLATESFLKAVSPVLRKNKLLVMPNVGTTWRSDVARAVKWGKIAHGYFREHFLRWGDDGGTPVFKRGDWARDTSLERKIIAAGVPFYAGSSGHARGEEDAMRYVRFSYLLFDRHGGGGFTWFANGDPYNGAWTDDLGRPVTAATRVGPVWTRRMAGGTIRVDSATGRAEIVVKAG